MWRRWRFTDWATSKIHFLVFLQICPKKFDKKNKCFVLFEGSLLYSGSSQVCNNNSDNAFKRNRNAIPKSIVLSLSPDDSTFYLFFSFSFLFIFTLLLRLYTCSAESSMICLIIWPGTTIIICPIANKICQIWSNIFSIY